MLPSDISSLRSLKCGGVYSDCFLKKPTNMLVETQARKVEAASQPAGASNAWRLLLVSSAALYLEIILIRWIGTEVRIFAFFQNLSLIACFLGFGLGCFNTKQRGSLLPSLGAITALV